MNKDQQKTVNEMIKAMELDTYGEKGLKEIIRQSVVEIVKLASQNNELSCEVDDLLAQPEQTGQEPVAWMWTRNYEGGGYTNMVFQMKCEADDYAKDSESLKRPDLVRPLYLKDMHKQTQCFKAREVSDE